MSNISVIIPVHEYTEAVKTLLPKAVNSVPEDTNLIIAGPADVIAEVLKMSWERVVSTISVESTSLPTIVNKAVASCFNDYFSILEFDDTYTRIWKKSFEEYKVVDAEAGIFLPLIEVYDYENMDRGPIGYRNEAAWASSFSEDDKLGFLTEDALLAYPGFNVTGAIISKAAFTAVGGLKESNPVSFWYEFLLRLIHNKHKCFVIPRVGYNHTENREGSLSMEIVKRPNEEVDWWFEMAKSEYLYKKDRKKTYASDNND